MPRLSRAPAIHNRIIRDFEIRIRSGKWHTGFRVPTEQELAAEYDCSRPTVAKALMLLEQRGMIERRKRAGSFVRRPPSQSIILQILDPESDISGRGQAHRYQLISSQRGPASGADRQVLEMKAAGTVLRLVSHHWADAQLFGRDERLINLDLLPEAAEVDFGQVPFLNWLLEHRPWRSGQILLSAAAASTDQARDMGLAPGAPLLCIERRIYSGEGMLSRGWSFYPADQRVLRAHFETGGPPGPGDEDPGPEAPAGS